MKRGWGGVWEVLWRSGARFLDAECPWRPVVILRPLLRTTVVAVMHGVLLVSTVRVGLAWRLGHA